MATKTAVRLFDLLEKDHRKVEGLFMELENAADEEERKMIFEGIYEGLTLHAEREEKYLYPEMEEREKTASFAIEAYEEHKMVKDLLEELAESDMAEEKEWQARAKVLREHVEHHVKEEESEMFPVIEKAFTESELEGIADGIEAMREEDEEE